MAVELLTVVSSLEHGYERLDEIVITGVHAG